MSSCQYLLPCYSEGSNPKITEGGHGQSVLRHQRFLYIPLLFREMAVGHRNEPPETNQVVDVARRRSTHSATPLQYITQYMTIIR